MPAYNVPASAVTRTQQGVPIPQGSGDQLPPNLEQYLRLIGQQGSSAGLNARNLGSTASDASSFYPYIDKGQFYWDNPSRYNPVPTATVPGAPTVPGNIYGSTAQSAQSFQDLLPYFQGAINNQIGPAAQAQYGAAATTSPEYNQLMLQLYQQYGPQLAQLGNQVSGINMAGQVGNENQILGGAGTDLLKTGFNASQIFDKPYYQTRDAAATQAQNLLSGSSDISGNLTGSEQNQIAQGLAREGVQRGTSNAPSQTETVSNAMQYGNAAFQRQQTEKSTLASAINAASQFLPTSKSGVNVFDTATGTNAAPNMGLAQFQGVNTQNMGTSIGSQVLTGQQQIGSVDLGGQYQTNMNNANIKANAKDWSDYLNQVTSSVGNIVGAAKGAGVICWVAREVYGENNPKWKLFSNWLLLKAPNWFRSLYIQEGERFAKFIHNKPFIKSIIRKWMDTKLCNAA